MKSTENQVIRVGEEGWRGMGVMQRIQVTYQHFWVRNRMWNTWSSLRAGSYSLCARTRRWNTHPTVSRQLPHTHTYTPCPTCLPTILFTQDMPPLWWITNHLWELIQYVKTQNPKQIILSARSKFQYCGWQWRSALTLAMGLQTSGSFESLLSILVPLSRNYSVLIIRQLVQNIMPCMTLYSTITVWLFCFLKLQ